MKELYQKSKKNIKLALEMLGKPEPNKPSSLPDELTFEKISTLVKNVMESSKVETKDSYQSAILDVSTWLFFAFRKNYLNANQNNYPNPLYVFKKGLEVLHAFLHRDLRRKQFSSEEDEIYRNYKMLVKQLPDPQEQKDTKNRLTFLKSG